MKKLVMLLFSFLLVVSAVSAATVDSVKKSITVDGDSGDWSGVPSQGIVDNTPNEPLPDSSDLSGSFRTAWDNQYVYFLIDVTDSEYDITGNDYIFERDSVEIMLDGGNENSTSYDSNDFQIHVQADASNVEAWANVNLVEANPGGIVAEAVQTSNGYLLEVGVAWSFLGGKSPGNGVTYGFDIAINDRDNEVYEDQIIWQYAPSHHRDPSGWGNLQLSGTASTASSVSLSSLDFTSSNTQNLDISVSDTVIYSQAYYSTDGGNDWVQFSLSGDSSVGEWVLSNAAASVSLNLAEVNVSGGEMVAFYACSWSGGWDCHGNGWQIRFFDVTLPEPSTGPVCDNGILETGEECDDSNFGGETCQTQGFDNGTLSCTSSCTIDTSGCFDNTVSTCGNGVIESGEACEPGNVQTTCTEQGYDSGTISCTSNCELNTSSCVQEPGTLTATTLPPSKITSYSAQLNMELTDWGVRDRGEPWFEWREKGATEWIATERREVNYDAPWIHDEMIGGLTPDTTYEVRARAFTWETTDAGEIIEFSTNVEIGSPETDRAALMALYASTNGDSWTDNTGWGGSADTLDSWYGVTTNSGGRVQRLELQENNLQGTIAPEIGELSELTYLQLEHNNLVGDLPPELGDLRSLTHLYLAGRPYTEPNYQTGGYHAGKVIDVMNNFSGTIPPELGKLKNLEMLRLERQGNMEGPIPPEIGNLTNLRSLLLYGRYAGGVAGFSGKIPPELGNLEDLVFLHIGRNAFTGPLPEEMGNLAKLKMFWFGGTNITSFPSSFRGMKSMRWIEGSGTNLEMPFPHFLFEGDLPYLTAFTFSFPDRSVKGFIGTLEDIDFTKTPLMNHFGVSGQRYLTGGLPPTLDQIKPEIMNIGWTDRGYVTYYEDTPGVNGTIPLGDYTNWDDTRYMRFNNNHLSGPIPVSMGTVDVLRFKTFSTNEFVFSDIIPALEEHNRVGAGGDFNYAPQREFGNSNSYSVSNGGSITIDDFQTEVTHPDNEYQWYKDGSVLSGATSRDLTISNAQPSDSGTYVLQVENARAPALTLESNPIEISVN